METTNSTGRSGSRHRRKRDSGNGHNEFSWYPFESEAAYTSNRISRTYLRSEIRVVTQGEGNFDEGADAVVDSRNKYLGITKEVLIAKALVDMGHQVYNLVTFKKGTSLRALLFSHICRPPTEDKYKF